MGGFLNYFLPRSLATRRRARAFLMGFNLIATKRIGIIAQIRHGRYQT